MFLLLIVILEKDAPFFFKNKNMVLFIFTCIISCVSHTDVSQKGRAMLRKNVKGKGGICP